MTIWKKISNRVWMKKLLANKREGEKCVGWGRAVLNQEWRFDALHWSTLCAKIFLNFFNKRSDFLQFYILHYNFFICICLYIYFLWFTHEQHFGNSDLIYAYFTRSKWTKSAGIPTSFYVNNPFSCWFRLFWLCFSNKRK